MSSILAAGAARMKLEAENYEARIAALEAQLAELAAENERLKQRLADHPRATSTVDAHETANVSDKTEGQQEPVAYIKNVLRIFGQGCTNAGPTSPFGGNPADCDECLTAAAMSIITRPSEQAVTEAMVEAAAIAISGGRKDLWGGFDLFKRASFRTRALSALKAAMEAGG